MPTPAVGSEMTAAPNSFMVILTGDALYGIVMTLVSTLALLVLMALAVGVLRAGMKNILPFLAVAGSGALLVLVSAAAATVMATLGILSFGPILMPYIVGRWLLLSAVATVAFGFLCIAGAAVCLIAWSSCLDYTDNHRTENAPATASSRLLQSCIRTCRRTNFAMRAWVAFVMPCYSLFVLLVVAAFSGLWSIAVGACIFIQGEAFAEWNGGTKRRWPLFMRFCEYFFVGPVLNYFPLRIFLADDASKLELERKYIFGYHPHGVYSFGLFALVFGHSSGFNRIFGSARPATPAPPPVGELWTRWQSSGGSVPTPRSLLVGVANVLLMVPICGNIVAWFGFIPASRRSLETACNTEHNLVLVPGGIAEMTAYAGDDTERVHLRDRTGFCRLALRKGRDLVPMFGFGENRTFRQYACCRAYRQKISRQYRVAIHLFRGRWFTLIPFPVNITVVVGDPIRIEQPVDSPTDAQVEALHLTYCAALRRLYEAHRDAYGYADIDLEML